MTVSIIYNQHDLTACLPERGSQSGLPIPSGRQIGNAQADREDAPDRKGVLRAVEDVAGALDELKIEKRITPVNADRGISSLIESLKGITKAFNLCEDFDGRSEGEAWIAGLLELIGIPYTGSPPAALTVCLNKAWTKAILNTQGIPTPPYSIIPAPESLSQGEDFVRGLKYPLILKPLREDASIGIDRDSVVYNLSSFLSKAEELLETYESLLVEEFIDGREVSISILEAPVCVLSHSTGREEPLIGISEIAFTIEPRVVCYRAKWKPESEEDKGTLPFYPSEESVSKEAIDLAIKAFRMLNLRGYGRVDMRIARDGSPFILEVNPNPDISRSAGFSKALEARGIEYTEIIRYIISSQ